MPANACCHRPIVCPHVLARLPHHRKIGGQLLGRFATSDGPRALEVAATLRTFDLLLTDLIMPKMTGDELARRLRRQRPALKVLYLTGYSDQLFERKGTLWADEAFLDKPMTVTGLLDAVSLLLFGGKAR